MDRKSIITLVVCLAMLFALHELTDKFFPPIKVTVPVGGTNQTAQVSAGNQTTGTSAAAGNQVASASGSSPSLSSLASRLAVQTNIPEQTLVITNAEAVYTFTSRGGGLKDVQLLGYPEKVTGSRKARRNSSQVVVMNEYGDAPVLSILGDESIQGDGVYSLRPINGGVVAEKTLANGLVISKEFHFSSNYIVNASVRLVNSGPQALDLPAREVMVGTVGPLNVQDKGYAQQAIWYDGAKTGGADLPGYFLTNTSTWFGFVPRVPLTSYFAGISNVAWASSQNQYFVMAAIPEKPAGSVTVRFVALPEPSAEEVAETPNAQLQPHGLRTSLGYPAEKLAAGKGVTNNFHLFIGPKKYQTIAQIASQYNNDFDYVMSFGWSWLAPVSKVLLIIMNWMESITKWPYGLLIIVLTVALRLCFWPITAATTRSSKRMQAFQPQLKALQEKYKDDPQKLTSKQWEFYKEHNINPLSGCLPMMVQIPVFFGFYGMLRTAIELRGAEFLWMGDLSKPDTLFSLHLPLGLLGLSDFIFAFNLMPLLSGLTQVWQASLMPANASMDASQQKMMRYMPLLAVVFMYSQPAGLALYWTVSNLLSVLQTKLTKAGDIGTTATAKVPAASVAPRKKK